MDATLSKLIQSRTKSCDAIESAIKGLEALASTCHAPAARAALEAEIEIKRKRLIKLRADIVAFRAADPQQSLPAVPPSKSKG